MADNSLGYWIYAQIGNAGSKNKSIKTRIRVMTIGDALFAAKAYNTHLYAQTSSHQHQQTPFFARMLVGLKELGAGEK